MKGEKKRSRSKSPPKHKNQQKKSLKGKPTHEPLLDQVKKVAFTAIEQQINQIQSVGEDIWRFSEKPGEEYKSYARLVSFLKKKGFKVTERYMGFDTAFRAEYGEGEPGGSHHPNIGFLCVYDADELTGHVKGNNMTTVVSLTAALGLQCVIKFSADPMGRITIIGCPGNKDHTQKIAMFEAGCFRKIDFILTASPAHYTNLSPEFLACKTYSVKYTGRIRTENDRPWEAANPVSAAVIAYQNVSASRQHFNGDWAVKGVIPSAGSRQNMNPASATIEFITNTNSPSDMTMLDERLRECFEAAASATGCVAEITNPVADFLCNVPSQRLMELYKVNAALNGFTFHNIKTTPEEPDDVANMSTSIPTYKVIYYSGDSSVPGSYEFNRYAGSDNSGFMSTVQGKTLAMLAVDLMRSDEDMRNVFSQHQVELQRLYPQTPQVTEHV